jgi:hypothetical protein
MKRPEQFECYRCKATFFDIEIPALRTKRSLCPFEAEQKHVEYVFTCIACGSKSLVLESGDVVLDAKKPDQHSWWPPTQHQYQF